MGPTEFPRSGPTARWLPSILLAAGCVAPASDPAADEPPDDVPALASAGHPDAAGPRSTISDAREGERETPPAPRTDGSAMGPADADGDKGPTAVADSPPDTAPASELDQAVVPVLWLTVGQPLE